MSSDLGGASSLPAIKSLSVEEQVHQMQGGPTYETMSLFLITAERICAVAFPNFIILKEAKTDICTDTCICTYPFTKGASSDGGHTDSL